MPSKKSNPKKSRRSFHNKGASARLSIGIVGCGTIGTQLARWLDTELKEKVQLIGLNDRLPQKADELAKHLSSGLVKSLSLDELIAGSRLVVEAASIDAVPSVARAVFKAGKDLVVMSVGGLLQNPGLFALAQEHSCKVYVPSGAIGGLDAIKAASLDGIRQLTLTTRKSPQALSDALYWNEKQKDWESLDHETVLFEGAVLEAIRLFPKNVNVAATLQLLVPKVPCLVRIIAVPGLKENIHEISLEGEAGRMSFRVENGPSPDNPRTSYLAVLSAKSLLREIVSSVRIGS